MKSYFYKFTALAVITVLCCGFIQNRRKHFRGDTFVAETAGFDGSPFLSLGDLTGETDSAIFTFSCWVDLTGGDGTVLRIYSNTSNRIIIGKTVDDDFRILMSNSGGGALIDMTSSVTKVASDGWFHLFVVGNTGNAGQTKIYFDGVEDTSKTVTTFTSGDIDFTRTTNFVGANAGAANRMIGSLAELYFSNEHNDVIGDYYSGGGSPVDLGPTGNLPTGTAPFLYLSLNGSGNSWAVDSSGNGNTFTVSGTLTSPAAP